MVQSSKPPHDHQAGDHRFAGREALAPAGTGATRPGGERPGEVYELGLESRAEEFRKRLAVAAKRLRQVRKDQLPAALVSALTSGERKRGDTAHLLVMDLHKALNRLQGELARESVDGARVYGLRAQDKELVRAFMRGLNSTQALKLDHPGLGTTAALSGKKLVLQNDIGTTDAHVLVAHVEGLAATVTYSDVHLERLLFFQSLFEKFAVQWDETRSRRESGLNEGGIYHDSRRLTREAVPAWEFFRDYNMRIFPAGVVLV